VGSSGRRETKTEADGTFHVAGCEPGKALLTAEAEGFAPSTLEVNLSSEAGAFRLTLQPGKSLRIRLLSRDGKPVAGATAWLDTFDRGPINEDVKKQPIAQANFNGKSDAEGRIVWNSAPDQELTFDFAATGFMRVNDVKVQPDGREHVVTLPPALAISGTVS